MCEPTLRQIVFYWGNFHCCNRPNLEETIWPFGHTVKLSYSFPLSPHHHHLQRGTSVSGGQEVDFLAHLLLVEIDLFAETSFRVLRWRHVPRCRRSRLGRNGHLQVAVLRQVELVPGCKPVIGECADHWVSDLQQKILIVRGNEFRLGDFLDFGQLFKVLGNNYFAQIQKRLFF